jgi:broad specificity phosphatase PhoE
MDSNNRLNDLIVISGRLAELLQRENEALRLRRTKDVHSLLDEKATLSRVYETRYKGIAEHPEIIAEADIDVRERLLAMGNEVKILMDENARLLETAISANRRVVELIAEAVQDQQPSAGVYGSHGGTSRAGSNAAAQRVAFTVDQNL